MKHLAILFMLLTISTSLSAQESEAPTMMPKWELYTQDGKLVRSEDFAGKPLILHFWATWCPFCKRLQPGLDQLAKKYGPQGLQVLGVSMLEEEGAMPQDELVSRGLSLKTVVNGESLGVDALSITGTPSTLFIAPDGRILGATMQSDPADPQWETVASYLVSLIENP